MKNTKTLDYCEVGSHFVPRSQLTRRLFATTLPVAQNQFTYSSPTAAAWTTADDFSYVTNGSMGPDLIYYVMHKYTDSNDNYVANPGSPSYFVTQGTIYEADERDVSDWDEWVFSVQVGPHHTVTENLFCTYEIFTYSEASTLTVHKTYAGVKDQTRIFWHGVQADLAALNPARIQFGVRITSDAWTADGSQYSVVFMDQLQLEKNVKKMGNFVATTGQTITRSKRENTYQVAKTCEKHKESLPTHSTKVRPPDIATPVVIPTKIEVP